MTVEERLALGKHAERLIADELFVAACRAVDAKLRDEVFRTALPDTEKREEIFAEYKGFQRILERLTAWKADGKIAEAEADRAGG